MQVSNTEISNPKLQVKACVHASTQVLRSQPESDPTQRAFAATISWMRDLFSYIYGEARGIIAYTTGRLFISIARASPNYGAA